MPIAFAQAKESFRERRVEPIRSRGGPILPISIHRPRICGKAPKLRAPVVANGVDGDPEQPRARTLAAEVIVRSPAKRDQEHLRCEIVGEHCADASLKESMKRRVVAIEQRRERRLILT